MAGPSRKIPTMSDIEQRLREAMDGVTPGPWGAEQQGPSRTVMTVGRYYVAGPSDVVSPHDGVCEPDRYNDRTFEEDAANMRYIALCSPDNMGTLLDTIASLRSKLEEAEGALERSDYFGSLVEKARQAAAKASVKFPQPNYVTLKIAEEAGEVVRGAVHYAEKRMEWDEVEGEIVQLLAMLIRFVTEGDQINGVIPPASLREADHA